MTVTRWKPKTHISESNVDGESVLVWGEPKRMAVLNRSGTFLWKRLLSLGGATKVGTAEDVFFRSLADMQLVQGEEVSEVVYTSTESADVPTPRILHSGFVEVLAFGATNGPDNKPKLPPMGTSPEWPFPEPSGDK